MNFMLEIKNLIIIMKNKNILNNSLNFEKFGIKRKSISSIDLRKFTLSENNLKFDDLIVIN